MKIKDIPTSERPRERLLLLGKESLSNEELLSIIIKTGTREKSVKDLALEVLKSVDDITLLSNVTINKLLEIKGIGTAKAIEILATIELGKRMNVKRKNTNNYKITTALDVYELVRDELIGRTQECFLVIYLNANNRIIERKILFMGTINKSIVHPREIFKNAYLVSASSIICVHNHPSGNKKPSREDINLTKALVEIGELQGIPVLDHLIVTEDDYFSFLDNHML